ncbi:MAG: c-type cytochrome, partial [Myxococcota bacterium]
RECMTCHVLEGVGPEEPEAPDLTGYASKAWIRQVLRDPDSPRLYGLTKIEGMESYAKIDPADMTAIVDILYDRRSATQPIEGSKAETLLEKHECTDCHEFDEKAGLEGPTLYAYLSEPWLRDMIDDPEADHLYGEANDMPSYKDRLPEDDRAALVAFLKSLEARADRSQWPFVDDPGPVPTPRPEKPEDNEETE